MADAPQGPRVYAIRLALGDGVRKALPLRELERLLAERGHRIHASELSKIEQGLRALSTDEVAVLAGLDPLRRGRSWLAWGEEDVIDGPPPSALESL